MKYKVGDKVVVRKDLEVDKNVGDTGILFNKPMSKFAGKTVTIRSVTPRTAFSSYGYIIEEDVGEWNWIDEMFEDNNKDLQKQTVISIKDGTLKVQYTTNTKKNNISIQRSNCKIGKIKLDEIDRLIDLLTQLKSEV